MSNAQGPLSERTPRASRIAFSALPLRSTSARYPALSSLFMGISCHKPHGVCRLPREPSAPLEFGIHEFDPVGKPVRAADLKLTSAVGRGNAQDAVPVNVLSGQERLFALHAKPERPHAVNVGVA